MQEPVPENQTCGRCRAEGTNDNQGLGGLRFDNDYILLHVAGTVILRDEKVLRSGKYYIATNGKLVI